MSEYKRLTERDEFGNADIIGVDSMKLQGCLTFEELRISTKALNRLAELEDKIESGKLVELPCEIGDTIWVVYSELEHGIIEYKIQETKCIGFEFENGKDIRIVTLFRCYDLYRFGNFTDKKQAEARLKELRGEE